MSAICARGRHGQVLGGAGEVLHSGWLGLRLGHLTHPDRRLDADHWSERLRQGGRVPAGPRADVQPDQRSTCGEHGHERSEPGVQLLLIQGTATCVVLVLLPVVVNARHLDSLTN